MISLFRIDDRLIHGQVAMAWSKAANADIIIAVDKTAANDQLQKMALLLAKPSGVEAKIIDPKDFAKTYQEVKESKVMVVVGNPIDASKIVKELKGKENFDINLGNLKSGDNKEKISGSIYVTQEEKLALEEIKKDGFKIYIQGTPTSKKDFY
ncbi:PTS sugar transporter subunit IIB [Lactobacillus sp. M0398]|uniref:PTS sugar transporter subunit IIB n=1 Tax=unclassified Lactobacillus TaxID=2620435 RepID=UPI0018DBB7AC|nr:MULTISPECIES: PTS sugar transporter subunit IIB [unclassified Lactobacillus]MBI0033159.1 PTS sugar transporter subunit IIB [Lactobacillus sp. M0396]MBI0120593.1 PTS sugar transporter subunit IIB [Lactobacillus sp. M0398]MBI0122939.1 PTS sugar transporter subunit IIB [Lactobacillus sp. W8174]MBI0134910.1 PTS sugar transporter subunit IIB [Lactobacillus sp. W8173]